MTLPPLRAGFTASVALAAAIIMTAGVFLPLGARAADERTVTVSGSDGVASVRADGGDGQAINGFDITLTFDPAVARAMSVEPGDGWSTDLVAPTIDNTVGKVRVIGVALSPGCGNGCELFRVRFAATTEAATATVTPSSIQLANPDGVSVPATGEAGQVPVSPQAAMPSRGILPLLAADGTN
jgi:hypothetical protein